MKLRKHILTSIKNHFGGGDFAQAKLTPVHTGLTSGRLSPFAKMVAVALFAFMAGGGVCSCSGSDGEEQAASAPVPDYSKLLTQHEWRLSSAEQNNIVMPAGDFYFRFTADSLFCTQGEEVNYFDQDGNVTHTAYELTLMGRYPYYIKGDELQVDTQTLHITENIQGTDTLLVLKNKAWRLVLKKK